MEDLRKQIEKLESFVDNAPIPNDNDEFEQFIQSINDHISYINAEYDYYKNEMREKDQEIEELKDKMSTIRNISDV